MVSETKLRTPIDVAKDFQQTLNYCYWQILFNGLFDNLITDSE